MSSEFPWRIADQLDRDLVNYLDKIGKPLPAQSDLSSSATTAQMVTAFNTLLSNLRAAGKMDP